MYITVSCPKCGRNIRVKKKYALSTGGVPCLKCKVRIPVTREQVEAYKPAVAAEDEAPPAETGAPEGPGAETTPEAPAEPVPEPEPAPPPAPIPEAAMSSTTDSVPMVEETEHITGAISLEHEQEAEKKATAAQEAAMPGAGPQVSFTCQYCQANYPLRQSLAGKKIRCKGCSRIVKVAPDSPVIPGNEPAPEPPPVEDDIPVVFSPAAMPPVVEEVALPPPPTPPPPPLPPLPPPAPFISSDGPATEVITRLRKALSEAEERANSAEEMLHRSNQDKMNAEMTSFRKIRELESQIRDLTSQLKERELESRSGGGLKRADVESLLKTLCDELDTNLKQEVAAHQNLVEDLKKQLKQALQ